MLICYSLLKVVIVHLVILSILITSIFCLFLIILSNCKAHLIMYNMENCVKFIYVAVSIIIIIIIIINSNWTEWSTIQRVIERVISKSDESEARGRFEITSTITPLIIKITISSNVIGALTAVFCIN